MDKVPIVLLALGLIVAGIINEQQDTKIKDLTERVYQLEQTK